MDRLRMKMTGCIEVDDKMVEIRPKKGKTFSCVHVGSGKLGHKWQACKSQSISNGHDHESLVSYVKHAMLNELK